MGGDTSTSTGTDHSIQTISRLHLDLDLLISSSYTDTDTTDTHNNINSIHKSEELETSETASSRQTKKITERAIDIVAFASYFFC